MLAEAGPIVAPVFWGRVIEQNPIVAITGASYIFRGHGVPSGNIGLPLHKGMLVEDELMEGRIPWMERMGRGEAFAIGALVYMWRVEGDTVPYFRAKTGAKYLCYEMEELERFRNHEGVTPVAKVMVDFDCQNSDENLRRIIGIMESDFRHIGWTIFDSGASFHLVFDGFVSPSHLPWHFGRIVDKFAKTSSVQRRHIFEGFGKALQESWWDLNSVEKISKEMLENICHYSDSVDSRLPFTVDLRHMAHSMLELLKFLGTGVGSFGFLRISDIYPYKLPPVVIACGGNLGETKFFDRVGLLENIQLRLPSL